LFDPLIQINAPNLDPGTGCFARSVIGTNRDLKTMQKLLDTEIATLCDLPDDKTRRRSVSGRILALQRKRIAICATLVNRRSEAAKRVVDLACWFNGNGALKAIENPNLGLVLDVRRQRMNGAAADRAFGPRRSRSVKA
jgi:hypothetical protein